MGLEKECDSFGDRGPPLWKPSPCGRDSADDPGEASCGCQDERAAVEQIQGGQGQMRKLQGTPVVKLEICEGEKIAVVTAGEDRTLQG